MRPDKVILAALAATLRLYRSGVAQAEIPIWRQVCTPVAALEVRARRIAERTGTRVAATESTIGGGSLPGQSLASRAIAIDGASAARTLDGLRAGDPPVIGRIVDGSVLLDLRTVDPADDERLAVAITATIGASSSRPRA
jgi:L-seryl-tRNA(Ser) seleniumtransferase